MRDSSIPHTPIRPLRPPPADVVSGTGTGSGVYPRTDSDSGATRSPQSQVTVLLCSAVSMSADIMLHPHSCTISSL
jgi:hypothetical protein